MRVYQPVTGLYFTWYIKPRNFAKRQRELQWLPPPKLPNDWTIVYRDADVMPSFICTRANARVCTRVGPRDHVRRCLPRTKVMLTTDERIWGLRFE